MAIGRITGPMLFDNLERSGLSQGGNLAFDGNLLYLDVTNRRIGISTTNPQYSIDSPGNVRLANLTILGNTISSNVGQVNFGSINNLRLTGGNSADIIYTDGNGNLRFASLSTLAGLEGFTGNNIIVGTTSYSNDGHGTNALTTGMTIADAINLLDNILGNITNISGNVITTGNLYLTGGSSNYILSTDGTGITSWVDANTVPGIATLIANAANQATSINSINANIGAFETYANANIGTLYLGNISTQANLGAYQLYANANATTQATAIDSINANLGAYQIYANANAASQTVAITSLATGANANTAAYLSSGSLGNITAGNIISTFYGNVHTNYILPLSGNVVTITGTGALQVPTGTTIQQPTPGVGGMIRYNTDIPSLEYYTGTMWVPITNTVTDQQIIPDGVNNVYTLLQSTTAVGIIVSINGVLQNPSSAYTVDGTQITFIETPLSDDIIDVRFLGASITIDNTLTDDLTVEGNLTVNGTFNATSFSFTDVIPQANVTYKLGNSTHQWKELWVSGSTIYVGNVPLSVSNGVLQVNGAQPYGNANVATYLLIDSTITSLQSNATTQATQINSTNANITSANSAISTLQSGLTTANASIATLQTQVYSNSNVNAYLTQNTIGALSTLGNLTVGGNLIVNGNTTTVNANTLIINDNIIYMANANPGNSLDIGFAGHFNNGTYQHTGLVRQAATGQWKLFSNLIPEPGNTLDFTNVVYDSIQVGAITSPTITDLYANAAVQDSAIALRAPIASPALTGTPTAPTANISVNNTQIATTAYVHNMLPSGIIMLWSGSSASIPYGWYLCDGNNGTPNLKDRFLVGAGNTYAVGATGGSADATVVSHSHTASSSTSTSISDPGHKHWISGAPRDDGNGSGAGSNGQMYGLWADAGSYSADDPNYGYGRYNLSATTGITAGSSTSTTVNATGNSATNANLPPYYALCYIMKS